MVAFFVGRILELDHGQRRIVDEHHDVGTPGVAALRDRELVDGHPRIGVGLIEVDDANLGTADGAASGAVLHGYPVHEHAVKGAVARHSGRSRTS